MTAVHEIRLISNLPDAVRSFLVLADDDILWHIVVSIFGSMGWTEPWFWVLLHILPLGCQFISHMMILQRFRTVSFDGSSLLGFGMV